MTGVGRVPDQKDMRHWFVLQDRIERGDHPSPRELASLVEKALKARTVPDAVWKYVGQRLRDEIHLGDGGRSKMGPAESRRKRYQRRLLCRMIERRRDRYAQIRLSKPRSKKVRPRQVPPDHPLTVVLRGSPTEFGHWRKTKSGTWRLRAPLQYAIRRVALDSDISEHRLRRWWKDRKKLVETSIPPFRGTSSH